MTIIKTNIHSKTFAIHWGDMDALNYMNHARFFDYFQECRIDWLESINLKLSDPTGPVVINAQCTYLQPLVYPATIEIISSIHSLGRTSFVVEHNVLQNNKQVASGSCKIVWIDYKSNQSIPFPSQIRSLEHVNS